MESHLFDDAYFLDILLEKQWGCKSLNILHPLWKALCFVQKRGFSSAVVDLFM